MRDVKVLFLGKSESGKTSCMYAMGGRVEIEPKKTVSLDFWKKKEGACILFFFDTPMNSDIVNMTLRSPKNICVYCIDSTKPLDEAAILNMIGLIDYPMVIVLTKKDADSVLEKSDIETFFQKYALKALPIMEVSSRTGQGIDELKQFCMNSVEKDMSLAVNTIRVSDRPRPPVKRDHSMALGLGFVGGFVTAVVLVSMGFCDPWAVGTFAAIGLGVVVGLISSLLVLCISCCLDEFFDKDHNEHPQPSFV